MPPSSLQSLRSAEHTPVLFTTNMGLEDVVVNEFSERCQATGISVVDTIPRPKELTGYAQVTAAAAPEDLFTVAPEMRSVHHVLAPLYTFPLPDSPEKALQHIRTTLEVIAVDAMEEAETFRVTTVREGDHDFTSIDVQREAGAGLEAHYGTTVDLEDYDVEVRVDVRHDQCLVSVQWTDEPLSRRHVRLYQPRAALKPNVAYGLLRLAHLDEAPDVLLDPFCGSGTILWEAGAIWPETCLVGNDWDEESIEGARQNAAAQGLTDHLTLHQSDTWTLAETFSDLEANLIVTNPPFGIRIGSSMDFRPFYRRILQQMHAVLRPGGRVVILVLRQGPFNGALSDDDLFTIRHVRVIEIGGLYPRVFVLERI